MAEKEQPIVKRRIMDYYESLGMTPGEFAKKCGIDVPAHEFLVNMVHAMENRPAQE
jgi:hypothetical protein